MRFAVDWQECELCVFHWTLKPNTLHILLYEDQGADMKVFSHMTEEKDGCEEDCLICVIVNLS